MYEFTNLQFSFLCDSRLPSLLVASRIFFQTVRRSFNWYQGIPGPGMVNGNRHGSHDVSLYHPSPLYPFWILYTSVSLPQVSSPFLTLVLRILSLLLQPSSVVRPSLPSLLLALHRAYRTIAGWQFTSRSRSDWHAGGFKSVLWTIERISARFLQSFLEPG